MREEALTSEVGKNWIPFEKKTRGKVWKPKSKTEAEDKNILPNELTDVLENASEAELMELAGISFILIILLYVNHDLSSLTFTSTFDPPHSCF